MTKLDNAQGIADVGIGVTLETDRFCPQRKQIPDAPGLMQRQPLPIAEQGLQGTVQGRLVDLAIACADQRSAVDIQL